MESKQRAATTPERLKEAMARTGMKPIDLARASGLSHSTISRYLSGAVEPRQEAATKLSKALGVSEFWLWGYDVEMVRTPGQKKNDDLKKVIVQLRNDPDFFDVVVRLAELPPEQYDSIKQLVSALGRK